MSGQRVTVTTLYGLGLLALPAVSLSLGGGETSPARWALIAVPVALFAAASLLVRHTRIDRGRPAPEAGLVIGAFAGWLVRRRT